MDEQVVTIKNMRAQPCRLELEPWGGRVDVGVGQVLTLRFSSSVDGQPDVDETEDGFTAWGWPSSTLRVESEGRELVHYDVPVPDPPAGMTVREFASRMFGKGGREAT